MADIADRAAEREEQERQAAIAAARGDIPQGKPGECDLCGEYSMRLVGGACAPCRDKYGLD